jgi:hypothetical protein
MLQLPKDSSIAYGRGESPAKNRNTLIKLALEHEFTHILFFDDDIAMPSDTPYRLLQHDKDMVTGLYVMRNYPHRPIIFDLVLDDARCAFHYLEDGESGLIPIVASGLGCCLIKTEVFKKMEWPWIRLGQLDKENWNDDIDFFFRAKKLGFELYCDLDVRCGHMVTTTVIPQMLDGKWLNTYDTMGTACPSFPIEKLSEKERIERCEFQGV